MPMLETIQVYDRSGYEVPNDYGALVRPRNLSWRTQIPGGYADCTFEVPLGFIHNWAVGNAYKLDVRRGNTQVFVGRLEDLTRHQALPGDLSQGWRKVAAYGYGQNLMQRLRTAAYAEGTVYASDILRAALWGSCPLISMNHDNIASTGINVQPVSWTNAYVSALLTDLLKYGDSAATPNQMLWAVWGEEPGVVGQWLRTDWHEGVTAGAPPAGMQPIDYQWVSSVVATCTISMSGAFLDIFTPLVGDAGSVICRTALPADKKWWMVHKFNTASITSDRMESLYIHDTASIPYVGATGNAVIEVYQVGTGIRMRYIDNGLNTLYWDGAAWAAPVVDAFASGLSIWYRIVLYSDGTSWQLQLQNAAGTTIHTTTTAVTWALTRAVANSLWAYFGDDNAGSYAGNLRSEFFYIYAPSTLAVPYFWARSLSDYELIIPASCISGSLEITDTSSEVWNNVLASYGAGPSYTAAATDSASVTAYDQRDYIVAAGSVPASVATTARDMKLNQSKDIGHRLGDLTLSAAIRNKAGGRYPLALVRAGQRFVVDALGTTVYLIGRTDYDADQGTLRISVEGAPDTVSMLLAKAAKASGV